jgi:hypothetical protein
MQGGFNYVLSISNKRNYKVYKNFIQKFSILFKIFTRDKYTSNKYTTTHSIQMIDMHSQML